jgi:hypothetical protein
MRSGNPDRASAARLAGDHAARHAHAAGQPAEFVADAAADEAACERTAEMTTRQEDRCRDQLVVHAQTGERVLDLVDHPIFLHGPLRSSA